MLAKSETQLGGHDDGGHSVVADRRADLTRNYLAIASRYLALHHHRQRTLVGSSVLQLAVSTAVDFASILLPEVRGHQTRLASSPLPARARTQRRSETAIRLARCYLALSCFAYIKQPLERSETLVDQLSSDIFHRLLEPSRLFDVIACTTRHA